MYGGESWTVKKAERRRIDAFELWCRRSPGYLLCSHYRLSRLCHLLYRVTLAKHQLSVSNPNTPPESACLSLWTILPAWFSEASESTCVKPIERHLPQLYLPFMNSSPWEFFPVGCCPFHSSGYLENRDNYPPPNPVNDQVFQARVTSSDHSLC